MQYRSNVILEVHVDAIYYKACLHVQSTEQKMHRPDKKMSFSLMLHQWFISNNSKHVESMRSIEFGNGKDFKNFHQFNT